jgi:hypothetical protein
MAIQSGKEDVTLWLLNDKTYKPDITAKNHKGDNCLLLAVKENLPHIVNEIL